MAFLLTLLGTDTKFTPGEMDQGIPVSETLSFISTCVDPATKIVATGEPIPKWPEMDVPYRRPGVTVIEGPVTSGANVYEKIAGGVYELLNAMQDGEYQFTLMGHSRGAVECIVVSHEIQRIQATIRSCSDSLTNEDLIDIICASPCTKTKEQLQARLNPLKGQKNISFESMLQGFHRSGEGELEISLFALDPVPGVEHETMAGKYLSQVWWKDERHYVIPPIVKDYRQIVLENETSVGFRGIVPKAADPEKTQYKLLNMLGHHGTASGNPLDQTHRTAFIKDADKTRDCQIVTMAQLYDFLGKHGVQFKMDTTEVFLTPYFNEYHQVKLMASRVIESNKFKKKYYDRMSDNRSFYEVFNQTYYPAGQEDMHTRLFWRQVDDDRKLYTSHLDPLTSLNSLIHFKRQGVINEEHAMLCVGLSLDFKLETQDQENYIQLFIAEFSNTKPNSPLQALETDRARGVVTDNIQNGIISIVNSLIETFLRNGMTEARKELILKTLGQLQALKSPEALEDDPLSTFKKDLYSSLLTEMRQGVDEQVTSQFADLSDLVFALEDNKSDGETFDVYRVAFSKREQFLSTANNLSQVIACFSYPDLDTKIRFEKQVRRLRYYAEAVELFCAKAMLISGLDLPEPSSSDEACFITKVRMLMQGLEGKLVTDNQDLNSHNQTKDFMILELQTKLQNQGIAHERRLVESTIQNDIKNQTFITDMSLLKDQIQLGRVREEQLRSTVDRLEAGLTDKEKTAAILTNQNKSLNAELVHLQEIVRKTNLQCHATEHPFSGISLQIIGGFAAVIGIAAVSLAGSGLMLAISWQLATAASIGTSVAVVGLFAYREGAQRQVKEAVNAVMNQPPVPIFSVRHDF